MIDRGSQYASAKHRNILQNTGLRIRIFQDPIKFRLSRIFKFRTFSNFEIHHFRNMLIEFTAIAEKKWEKNLWSSLPTEWYLNIPQHEPKNGVILGHFGSFYRILNLGKLYTNCKYFCNFFLLVSWKNLYGAPEVSFEDWFLKIEICFFFLIFSFILFKMWTEGIG